MICRLCMDKFATSVRSCVENGEIVDLGCDRCLGIQPNVPDVYWPGQTYTSESLGVEFTSRGQKAKYLKDNNLSEAGDVKFKGKNWIEGSREYRKKQFESVRPTIKETYRKWRDGPRDKR